MVENRLRLWVIESLNNPDEPAARPLFTTFPGTLEDAIEHAVTMAAQWNYHRPKVRLAQPADIFNMVSE